MTKFYDDEARKKASKITKLLKKNNFPKAHAHAGRVWTTWRFGFNISQYGSKDNMLRLDIRDSDWQGSESKEVTLRRERRDEKFLNDISDVLKKHNYEVKRDKNWLVII